MARQVDIFEFRESCQYEIDQEAENHYQNNGNAILSEEGSPVYGNGFPLSGVYFSE